MPNNYIQQKTAVNSSNSALNETQTSIDAFFRGKFYLVQPKSRGHRSGLDALLLASTIPNDFKGHIADFGSGSGCAALAVLARCSQVTADLVENSLQMVKLGEQTLALPQNKQLSNRARILNIDLNQAAQLRRKKGLKDNFYDFIIMNPPYNKSGSTISADELKTHAHVMSDNLLQSWLRAAVCSLHAKGSVAIIARPYSLSEILHFMQPRFGNIKIYPIYPKFGENAIRVIVTGTKSSRSNTEIMSPIFIRFPSSDGQEILNPFIDDLSNGRCSLGNINNSEIKI